MENILWVFYFIVLLAATSCALQADGAPSADSSSEAQEVMMATTVMGDEQITITNQGNETAGGSTIYVTLPPDESNKMNPEVASSGPASATSQMPSMSTSEAASAAPPAPEPSPSPAQPAMTTAKPPAKAPASNEIPQQKDEKPATASKNSHEKSQAMENAAGFPTTSSLPILVGVVALTLLIHP